MSRRESYIYAGGLMSDLARSRVVFSPDADTGGTGDATNTNQNAGGNNKVNENNNNEQDNSDNFNDLWHDNTDNAAKGDTSTNKTGGDDSTKQNNQDNLNQYLDTINFNEGVDVKKAMEDISNGNFDTMQDAFKSIGRNAYKKAIVDSAKIMDVKIKEAVDTAVKTAGLNINADMAVSSMEQRLNFTKDPAIAPVARGVLSQLMKKGKSLDDAIAGVEKFFSRTSQLVNKNNKGAPRGRPGQNQFNNQSNAGNDADDDSDELDFLSMLQV